MRTQSRRSLLAGFAAAGAVSGLDQLQSRRLYAQAQGSPKRILCVFSPMGYLENSFWPTGNEADFILGETMTALEPWKRHLIYLDGLALFGPQWYFGNDDNEHGNGASMVFTGAKKNGFATGPSVEQAVAQFQDTLSPRPLRSLTLGVNAGVPSAHTAVFFSKAQTPVAATNSPKAAFDLALGAFSTAERLRPIRQGHLVALGRGKGNLGRLGSLLGGANSTFVEGHVARMSRIEMRLASLSAPNQPLATFTSAPPAGTKTLVETVQAQMDLIVAAFACDLTRSASLQLGICDGGIDGVPGVNQHNTTNEVGEYPGKPEPIENHKKVDRWYASQWAYLLKQLDSIPEGTGSLLDNTLVVFGSDTSTLQQLITSAHQQERFPLWLAGGGNFAFKTGRLIKLASPTALAKNRTELAANWVPHQRLLTSICQAFGMNVGSFGDNDPGTGPIPQLTRV